MPQMNPISWLTLFTLFVLILILSNTINYFYPNKFIISFFKKINKINQNNWKW